MKRSRVALAWFLALYGALLAAVRVSGPSGVIASEVSRATRPGAEAGSHKLTTHYSELALDLYHPQCGLSYLWNRSGLPIQGPPSLAFHGPEQIRQFAPEALNHTSPVAERWQRRQLADQAQVEALARHFPKRKHPLQQR